MASLLLVVLVVLGVFAMSPALGFILLFIIAIGIAATISSKKEETEKNVNAIHTGSEKIWEQLTNMAFKCSKRIVLSNEADILIDSQNEQIAICDYLKSNLKILSFFALLSCEILESDTVVMKGGVGRAIVGGAIAGDTGAIVGAATRSSQSVVESLTIKIISSDVNESLVMIPLITRETKRDSDAYKKMWEIAQEVHSVITSIIQTTTRTANNTSSSKDALSQIQMLSELKDQGVLTEEEFAKKKAELLERV